MPTADGVYGGQFVGEPVMEQLKGFRFRSGKIKIIGYGVLQQGEAVGELLYGVTALEFEQEFLPDFSKNGQQDLLFGLVMIKNRAFGRSDDRRQLGRGGFLETFRSEKVCCSDQNFGFFGHRGFLTEYSVSILKKLEYAVNTFFTEECLSYKAPIST
jgi:hypothetical protein